MTAVITSDGDDSSHDASLESDNACAVLDRVVQLGGCVHDDSEFIMEKNIGPSLRYTTGSGLALTPVRMLNLEEDEGQSESGESSEYLKSCKSVEYLRVDGRPGLTIHRGRCRFWTAIEVTPEVIRADPG